MFSLSVWRSGLVPNAGLSTKSIAIKFKAVSKRPEIDVRQT